MNPKFSLLTSPPPEQKQQKQCFLIRTHDSTVVENQLLGQSTPTARAVRVFRSAANCSSSSCTAALNVSHCIHHEKFTAQDANSPSTGRMDHSKVAGSGSGTVDRVRKVRMDRMGHNLDRKTGMASILMRMAGSTARRTRMGRSTGNTAGKDHSMGRKKDSSVEGTAGTVGTVDTESSKTEVSRAVVDTKAVSTDRNKGNRDRKDRNTPL
ncbi:unnamed protein product [Leptosia nina]|uniref:Uncharacterized protein n=1 Tax=Leptosia nina TaxID=320188 RepID=A0AAV1JFM3_9NEOP